jgi:hypothetical protein
MPSIQEFISALQSYLIHPQFLNIALEAHSSLGGMVGRRKTLNINNKPTNPSTNLWILTMLFFMTVIVL